MVTERNRNWLEGRGVVGVFSEKQVHFELQKLLVGIEAARCNYAHADTVNTCTLVTLAQNFKYGSEHDAVRTNLLRSNIQPAS